MNLWEINKGLAFIRSFNWPISRNNMRYLTTKKDVQNVYMPCLSNICALHKSFLHISCYYVKLQSPYCWNGMQDEAQKAYIVNNLFFLYVSAFVKEEDVHIRSYRFSSYFDYSGNNRSNAIIMTLYIVISMQN